MTRISADQLRRTTLARQFPALPGREPADVLEVFDRLGPIQSQVPRSPFLTVSSRLPGVGYDVVRDLFATFSLLKTTNLRGTVHTTTRADFLRADAVNRSARAPVLRRTLKLGDLPVPALEAEIERFTSDEWRPRAELVAHVCSWLADHGVQVERSTYTDNLIWGHPGLIRRPRDSHWEKRTDAFHRLATTVAPLGPRPDPARALVELVRVHLRSYGPLTRADLSFFFGVGLGAVDAALAALADEVVRLTGPDDQPLLDLAEPPGDPGTDPGVRLLPEFDGLLVGYAGGSRTRFCSSEQLADVWARTNGVFSPVVLAEGRIVASWRTVTAGRWTDLEITTLPGERPVSEDAVADQMGAVAAVLALDVRDVRVLR